MSSGSEIRIQPLPEPREPNNRLQHWHNYRQYVCGCQMFPSTDMLLSVTRPQVYGVLCELMDWCQPRRFLPRSPTNTIGAYTITTTNTDDRFIFTSIPFLW